MWTLDLSTLPSWKTQLRAEEVGVFKVKYSLWYTQATDQQRNIGHFHQLHLSGSNMQP